MNIPARSMDDPTTESSLIYQQFDAIKPFPETRERDLSDESTSSIGVPKQRKQVDPIEILAVIISLVCLLASILVVSPRLELGWRLRTKGQLQIIGFLLSIMNQCLRAVTPRLFLILEATFGQSRLQNYDAILRNTVLLSHTHLIWRISLMIFILLPLGLSFAYKDFQQGLGYQHSIGIGNFYGPLGQTGLGSSSSLGLSWMASALTPLTSMSLNGTPFPNQDRLPMSFGFNGILLNETSAAFVDVPSPDYVNQLQNGLLVGESCNLTATVNGTVTTYNHTVEEHRTNDDYWADYGLSEDNISDIDLNNGLLVGTLQSNDGGLDTDDSWIFVSIYNKSSWENFPANATQFTTRRQRCQVTWTIQHNLMEIRAGSCDPTVLSAKAQEIFTNADLGLAYWYLPTLADYLSTFSAGSYHSQWKIPTFTTVVSAMYWSRIVALEGPQLNYTADSSVHHMRPTMNTPWGFYIVLVCQPVLTAMIIMLNIAFHRAPISTGFGMIAILAGIRAKSLRLIDGASFSGKLNRPLRMTILTHETYSHGAVAHPKNEYVLGEQAKNDGSLLRVSGHGGSSLPGGWRRGWASKRQESASYEMMHG